MKCGRWRDIDLAEWLGLERPRDIRAVIERNRAELERHGPLRFETALAEDFAGFDFAPVLLCTINEMERGRRLGRGVAMQIQATDARDRFWSTAFRAFVETVKCTAVRVDGSVGAAPIGNPGNVAPMLERHGPLLVVPTTTAVRQRRRHVRKRADNPGTTVEQA